MSNKSIAIEVKNLSITYKSLKAYSIKKNLLKLKKVDVKKFKAVNNVSFEVEEGKILGIIGKNGSGKSTMLKALAGIFSPDEGIIDLHNKSVSLLSIGVGFNKNLSGRENIMLSGMLLGFSEEEIKEKMTQIIEFAEIGDFITAILETDIMLIDEVLSVGDQKFKKKSYKKMKELISDNKRTVVIVSHNISTLKELCDEVMWMHEGVVKKIGDPKEVLDEYTEFMK